MAFAPVFGRPFAPTFDRHAAAGNGLLNALIAYWPGNEASGNLLDAHTNALHLTDTNTVTNAAGKVYATARQYTAATKEYHTRASSALLQAGDVDFTVAAWVYLDSKTAARYFVGKDDQGLAPAGDREHELLYSTLADRFRFVVFRASDSAVIVTDSAVGSPSTGAWYFLVGWHDAASDTVYIQVNNNTPNSAATGGALQAAGSAPWTIGAANVGVAGELLMDGRIGPVAMWKSAAGGGGVLTAAQRTALYNGGAGLAYAQFTI